MKHPIRHKPLCLILPSVLSVALSACGGGEASQVLLPSLSAALPSHSASAQDALLKNRINELNSQIQAAAAKLEEAKKTRQPTGKQASQTEAKPDSKPNTTSNDTPELDKALAQIGKPATSPQEDEATKKTLIELKTQIALLQKEKEKLQELVSQGVTDKALLAQIESLKAQLAPYLKKEEEANQQLTAEQEEARKRKEAYATLRITQETARLNEEKTRLAKLTLKNGDDSVVKALQDIKAYYQPARDHFGGAILTVNHKDKTAKAVIMPEVDYSIGIDKDLQGKINGSGSLPNGYIKGEGMKEALQNFRIGNTPINLLEKDGTKYHLQKLTAENFTGGGFDKDNFGIVGSKWGDANYSAFGQLRYGVYNDNQGNSHLFVYGNPSSQNPHGSPNVNITYRGSAIISKGGQYRELPKAVTAVLDKNKTDLDISIQVENQKLDVKTKIEKQFKEHPIAGGAGKELGQKFFGENNQMSATGALFGPAEIGGFFAVKEGQYKGEHGVFGATFDNTYLSADKDFKDAHTKNNPY